MASLSHQYTYPMRPTNKEPQWATVYDDLFAQYIDTDGFEFGSCNEHHTTTSSSDEASNIESNNSSTTFTDISESSSEAAAARRLSDDFWARTLAVLESGAAEIEQRDRPHTPSHLPVYLNTKNTPHADFLSLGGFPSPHISEIVPPSPSVEAAARRRKAVRHQQERSIKTPERPVGVKKTYRSSSRSPKMMSPSRYRAGFQEAWIESIYQTPARGPIMNLPVRSMPLTPPSSGRNKNNLGLGFANMCSPNDFDASPFQPFANYEEQTSPFTSSFPSQGLPKQFYSPESSPLTSPSVERSLNFNTEEAVSRDVYYTSQNQSAWPANSFAAQDLYQPSPTYSPWLVSERKEAEYQASLAAPLHVHSNPHPAYYNDPTLAPSCEEMVGAIDITSSLPQEPYYTTNMSRAESRTPSPPRRTKRASSGSKPHSRKASGDQRVSRASKSGGFVNYTPSDSEKLLTGVAPSGSSKTKARREKEAAEKWRRFSQAAAKAVAEAGGDVAPVANMIAGQDGIDASAGGSWS